MCLHIFNFFSCKTISIRIKKVNFLKNQMFDFVVASCIDVTLLGWKHKTIDGKESIMTLQHFYTRDKYNN